MTIARLIDEIEAATYRSWPAREVAKYDGWQLRFADGFSRRGNSVYPRDASTLDHGPKLAWCAQWFRQRGLELVVRQNPATEAGLDDVLAALGYRLEGRTDVMVADIRDEMGGLADVAPEPSTQWWGTMAELWQIGPDRSPGWRGIIERIELPSAFSLRFENGKPAAAGLAVVDRELLGLFEIIVAPNVRRSGIGIDLARSLLAWGRREGATRSYLQVVAENEPAIAMYQQLGFQTAYSYWYRRAPVQTPAKSPA